MGKGNFLSYEGPFGIRIISALAKFLQENIDAPEQVREKLYRVFIELAQNIALYSFDRVQLLAGIFVGIGKVSITEEGNELHCTAINMIQKGHGPVLKANCNEINQASIPALRTMKKKLYKKAEFEDTGAHIGLIMISIYSDNPLNYEIIDEGDNKIYFKISAIIHKGKNS